MTKAIAIAVDQKHAVSALFGRPDNAKALIVLAHGAGAGMTHPFMEAIANGFDARRVATLRYNFPFMEVGSKRPDAPATAQAAVKAAVYEAARLAPDLPLFAGGKSFGGRMTSQAQAAGLLPNVQGLTFLGFPLHPANKQSASRAAHLRDVHVPMLFVQGTRDALADAALIASVTEALGAKASLQIVDGADHSFHVLKRSGRNDEEVLDLILDTTAEWIDRIVAMQ